MKRATTIAIAIFMIERESNQEKKQRTDTYQKKAKKIKSNTVTRINRGGSNIPLRTVPLSHKENQGNKYLPNFPSIERRLTASANRKALAQ